MTDEHDDMQRRLDDAFERRASSMSVHPPRIDELVVRSQQRSRRLRAGATLTVLAAGTVGFAALASQAGDSPTHDALPEPVPAEQTATTISVRGEVAATWQCTGPLGSSDDGAVAYFESCAPGGDAESIPATTTELVGLAPCTPVGDVVVTTTTAPASPSTTPAAEAVTTTANPEPCPDVTEPVPTTTVVPGTTLLAGDSAPGCTTPGCLPQEYAIQTGDYPLRVAEMACVTVDALVAANGWSGPEEFPFPGVVIRLPPAAGECVVPQVVATTIEQ